MWVNCKNAFVEMWTLNFTAWVDGKAAKDIQIFLFSVFF